MTFQNVLYLVDVVQPCIDTTAIIGSSTLHGLVYKQQIIVTNSALIYWCTFSLLVEYKKLDIVVITHNFNVTPSVRNNEQL